MISEKTFILTHTSFWQDTVPLGENFVRKMNLSTDRFVLPLESRVDPTRRGFVNEVGFLLTKYSKTNGQTVETLSATEYTRTMIEQEAKALMYRYKGSNDSEISPLSLDEWEESLELSKRIRTFMIMASAREKETIVAPAFSGCGFIDACAADLLVGRTLCELKSGDRSFRLIDVKQMVTYLALNYANPKFSIEKIGFVNPRHGTAYRLGVADFVNEISGKNSVELLIEVIDYISGAGISR